jgi:hypothetical protein
LILLRGVEQERTFARRVRIRLESFTAQVHLQNVSLAKRVVGAEFLSDVTARMTEPYHVVNGRTE